MNDIIDELQAIHDKATTDAHELNHGKVGKLIDGFLETIEEVHLAWSESWIGYQASLYLAGFRPKQPGEFFDIEWGLNQAFSNTTRGSWQEYSLKTVQEHIEASSGQDFSSIQKATAKAETDFRRNKRDLLGLVHALASTSPGDKKLQSTLEEAEEVEERIGRNKFIKYWTPSQFISRDSRATTQGIKVPPHLNIKSMLLEAKSYGANLQKLGDLAGDVANYLRTKQKIAPAKTLLPQSTGSKVFIGHGGSSAWKDLKTFLTDTLHLEVEEFNIQSAAGLPTSQRLEDMANQSAFAFLVLTAEDEHQDSTIHARENVIHEVGYFQGKLGFRRAIVLLEAGCEEFSNIVGLGQIRFYKGDIMSKSEEIRKVLKREDLIS